MAKLIELKEAAEKMGITPEMLTEMVDNKEIFGYRDGASWKFKPSEIERVIADKGLSVGGAVNDAVDGASELLGLGNDDADDMIDVDELKLDDDSDDGADSILVTEEELGRSDESTGSTIIGKTDVAASADSDIKLSDETLSVAGDSDISLDGSGISLDGGSDLSLADSDLNLSSESAGASDVLAGDSDLLSLDDGGTGAVKSSGSGIDLSLDDDLSTGAGGSSVALSGSDSLSLDDELKLEGDSAASGIGADSAIDLDLDDDDLFAGSGTGSDITLGASDSGINLSNPSDSGISLEDVSSEMGSGIDLGDDDMIELEADPADPDDVTDLQTDDEFMLTPVASDGDLDEESDDSGSQVIALDSDEFDESAATMLVEDDPLGDADDAFGGMAAASAVTAGAAAGVATSKVGADEEADFSMWNIVSLSMLSILMGISGLLALDVIRNIWSWEQPFSVNSSLLDILVGLF